MNYGFNYSGSKSKMVKEIICCLPKADNLYDLFGGGGSVSHYACTIKKYKNIFYNELNPHVFDLFKRAVNGEKFNLKWISREDFFRLKDKDPLVKYIYSFSSNGSTYRFGTDIEPYKRSAHQAVVFGEFDETAISVLGFDRWPKEADTIKKRRFYWRQKVAFNSKGMKRGDLEQLEQLERLQQLEQLKNSSNLHLSNLDYRNVNIKENSVIYCDIPYLKAAKNISYISDGFDHKTFYDWALSSPFPVYVSEYFMPKDFKCIYTLEKINLYSSSSNKSVIEEKIYWNGK